MAEEQAIIRFPDWEARLAVYLDRVRDDAFQWGRHDCVLFASGAVEAMTGIDPAAGWRESYDDAQGAALVLRQTGHRTLHNAVSHWLGQPRHVALGQRGDVVMRGHGLGSGALGICTGPWCWYVGEENGGAGLVALPTAEAVRAWRVGR